MNLFWYFQQNQKNANSYCMFIGCSQNLPCMFRVAGTGVLYKEWELWLTEESGICRASKNIIWFCIYKHSSILNNNQNPSSNYFSFANIFCIPCRNDWIWIYLPTVCCVKSSFTEYPACWFVVMSSIWGVFSIAGLKVEDKLIGEAEDSIPGKWN